MSRFAIATRILSFLLIALSAVSNATCAPRSNSDQADQPVKGDGIIDRVIVTGSEPVFRADGYTFRVTSTTELRFSCGLQSLCVVGKNTWARFEGTRDDSGAIVATKAAFARLKLPKSKPDSDAVQVTTFPPGSKVDGYKGFSTDPNAFPQDDHGGWCGWYDVTNNPTEQEHIRSLGMKLVPQYQRDLPANDPAKIPFRFYVIEERETRSAIFCANGLVLVPIEAVNRLQNDDQLAAVVADGIAGELQLQEPDVRGFTWKDAAVVAADGALGLAGPLPGALGSLAIPAAVGQRNGRIAEHGRGRMALAFTADAGFDPHQAPEAWRLVAPSHLPKDRTKLKTPERSLYLQTMLQVQYKDAQYKAVSGDVTPEADHPTATAPGSGNGIPIH